MPTTPRLQHREPQRQPGRQPDLVSDARQQCGAGVRDQARSVRRDFYRYTAPIAHHPQGEPPSSGSGPSTSPRIPAQPDVSAPPPTGGADRYCTPRAEWIDLVRHSPTRPSPIEQIVRALTPHSYRCAAASSRLPLPTRSRGRPRKNERPQRLPKREHPIKHLVTGPQPTRAADRSKPGRPRAHDPLHPTRTRTTHNSTPTTDVT
jgi:hypothetical protein